MDDIIVSPEHERYITYLHLVTQTLEKCVYRVVILLSNLVYLYLSEPVFTPIAFRNFAFEVPGHVLTSGVSRLLEKVKGGHL
jgi:hypothetical protein